MAVSEPKGLLEDSTKEALSFIALCLLLAFIGIAGGWAFTKYPDRVSTPDYWWRVAGIGLMLPIALAIGARLRWVFKTADHPAVGQLEIPPKIGIHNLTAELCGAAYFGVATWTRAESGNWWMVWSAAAIMAFLLANVLRKTRKFFDRLEQQRYRTDPSPSGWIWLTMTIIGGQSIVQPGYRLLGTAVAAATSISFTIYLLRREEDALATLPPAPAPKALDRHGDEWVKEDPKQPWDGLPPFKPLL